MHGRVVDLSTFTLNDLPRDRIRQTQVIYNHEEELGTKLPRRAGGRISRVRRLLWGDGASRESRSGYDEEESYILVEIRFTRAPCNLFEGQTLYCAGLNHYEDAKLLQKNETTTPNSSAVLPFAELL